MSEPQESEIFAKYPAVRDNSHVRGFICGSFMAILDGSVRPAQLASLMEADLKTNEEEHHAPLNVLTKTADSLPGFGIVAAVLGIVVTIGAIDRAVEEIGEKVGAALVGTFLGILLSYGFVTPLSVNMEFLAAAETAFLRAIATALDSFVKDLPPKLSIELARRGVSSEHRPPSRNWRPCSRPWMRRDSRSSGRWPERGRRVESGLRGFRDRHDGVLPRDVDHVPKRQGETGRLETLQRAL